MAKYTKQQWKEKYVRLALKQGETGCTVSSFLAARPGTPSRRLQDEAAAELQEAAVLFRVGPQKASRGARFLHRIVVQRLAARIRAAESSAATLDAEQVLASYKAVVDRGGVVDIRVADLAAAIPCGPEALKTFILDRRRQGKAVLSHGDWSLASEAERAAAIEVDGEPYLRVRLEA